MIFSDNKKVIKIQNTLKNIPCPKGGVGVSNKNDHRAPSYSFQGFPKQKKS